MGEMGVGVCGGVCKCPAGHGMYLVGCQSLAVVTLWHAPGSMQYMQHAVLEEGWVGIAWGWILPPAISVAGGQRFCSVSQLVLSGFGAPARAPASVFLARKACRGKYIDAARLGDGRATGAGAQLLWL